MPAGAQTRIDADFDIFSGTKRQVCANSNGWLGKVLRRIKK